MLIYRAQATQKIGFGHLKRSVYLASLIRNQSDVRFVLNRDKRAAEYVKNAGFDGISEKQIPHLDWKQIKGILFDIRFETPIDHSLIETAKRLGIPTIQISDLGLSQLGADLLINPSVLEPESVHPDTEDSVSGLSYAILHHRFIHFYNQKRRYKRGIKNILISLGGGVEYRVLKRIIDILHRQGFRLKITGGFYLKKSAVKILKRAYPGIRFTGYSDSIARALFESDLAVIASGTTAFEAAAVGTPALYFHYNEEQGEIAAKLDNLGVGKKISPLESIDKDKLLDVLMNLSLSERESMGKKGKERIDGKGVYRIIDLLTKKKIIGG